jgi:hypothetical protein
MKPVTPDDILSPSADDIRYINSLLETCVVDDRCLVYYLSFDRFSQKKLETLFNLYKESGWQIVRDGNYYIFQRK